MSMAQSPIALVVARSRNNVIGAKGGIPWRLKTDLVNFKAITLFKPVIMGRATWDSLPFKPLPDDMMRREYYRTPVFVQEIAHRKATQKRDIPGT